MCWTCSSPGTATQAEEGNTRACKAQGLSAGRGPRTETKKSYDEASATVDHLDPCSRSTTATGPDRPPRKHHLLVRAQAVDL